MADVLTTAQRSKCMAAIRSADTKPEAAVRRTAHRLSFRYRLHVSGLPGRPDLVFPRLRAVIFVHGCFWHQHRCSDGRLPGSRQEYWLPKLKRNQERDRTNRRKLRRLGWQVLVIWECATTNVVQLERRISRFLNGVETTAAKAARKRRG